MSARLHLSAVLRHLLLIVFCVFTVIPLAYVVSLSFRYFRDIIAGSFVSPLTLSNYADLFQSNFLRLLLNSLVTAAETTVISVLNGALAAYALARFVWPAPWRNGVMGWMLFVRMLPPIIFVGPLYLLARNIGIYNSPLGVMLGHVVIDLPFATLLLLNFFADVPKELEEAAAIDRASNATIFFRVALPITWSGIAATGMLAFVVSWNEFLYALVLTSTPRFRQLRSSSLRNATSSKGSP
ncbi:MAG: carbohydrate ABC transporter permease [Firmicutes bacterium]|nr:carbohydrate ABC transporter permease [Bacillota bacterium]